jgi:hypothetical protein
MSFQDFSSSRQQPRSASSAQPGLGSQGASPGRPSAAYSAPQQHAAGSDPLSQASEALLQYQVPCMLLDWGHQRFTFFSRTCFARHPDLSPAHASALNNACLAPFPFFGMQRNVGILENIVASMTTSSSSSISSRAKGAELLAQYEAQVDVLEHLGRKVQRLLEGGGGGGSSGGRSGTARTKLARDFERVKAQAANLQERVARFQRATAAASASAGANFSGAASSSSSGPDHYHQQVQLQLQQDVRFSWRRWRALFSCSSAATVFFSHL